jgi:hypothetical protein
MIKIKVIRLGKCVCGKNIYGSISLNGVAHDLPYCNIFIKLEPDKFLTFIRKSRGIPDEKSQ